MNTIKTKHNFYPNTSFTFDATGVYVELTLNIPPILKKYLSVNNVFKGEKRLVYCVRKHIDSIHINKKNVEDVHQFLLNNCMIAIRKAKQEYLENNINNIKKKQIELNF